MVRLMRLAFFGVGALSAPSLTPWQQQLMAEVEATAAKLSEAAVPAILATLDSSSFREHLSNCCPSVAQLPAKELLAKLDRHIQAAEVASGFPAIIDPAQMYPDSAGMSIDYGLNGPLFLNDWQAVLLHTQSPAAVFGNVTMQYSSAVCDMEKQAVSIAVWPEGCSGNQYVMNYSLEKCYSPAKNLLMKYTCSGGNNLTRVMWMSNGNDTEIPFNETVTCPTYPPIDATSALADGVCQGVAVQNNTEGWIMQDHAETFEYGLKPFKHLAAPGSMDEGNERPVYSLVNINLVDQGSPIYGDVSAVFSTKYILNSSLVSAVDTGFVETCCIEKKPFPWAPVFNCSAITPFKQLGTLKHYKHFLVINEGFWSTSSSLRSAFARMEGDWGSQPLPGRNFLNYYEAAVLGQLELASSVKFLIGAFPTLFGTDLGVRLQEWARRSGKVLVWALGPNNLPVATRPTPSAPAFNFDLMTQARGFPCNQRILDPTVLPNTSAAASLSPPDPTFFKELWDKVTETRRAGSPSNTTVAEYWHVLSENLPTMRVRPLRGEDCPKELLQNECVGVTLQGQCICYEEVLPYEALVV